MTKKYSLFIGRWQPFHAGHKELIDSILAEGKNVCIAIRATDISNNNPLTTSERYDLIRTEYPDRNQVQIIIIPDIEEICYGRDVGYGIREIRLDAETEAISGTKLRTAKELEVFNWNT